MPAPDLTTKQFGDICEHHVIASLGFAGIPAHKVPDGRRAADVIAEPFDAPPQQISVKGRRQNGKATHVDFVSGSAWDWLAVIVREDGKTKSWMLPRPVAMALSSLHQQNGHRLYLNRLAKEGGAWAENFTMVRPVTQIT